MIDLLLLANRPRDRRADRPQPQQPDANRRNTHPQPPSHMATIAAPQDTISRERIAPHDVANAELAMRMHLADVLGTRPRYRSVLIGVIAQPVAVGNQMRGEVVVEGEAEVGAEARHVERATADADAEADVRLLR